MGVDDLCFRTAAELRELYRSGDVSPVEVTRAVLDRMLEFDSAINAVVTPTPDLALDQARVAEEAYRTGKPTAPLSGIPVSLKDLTATKGIRTARGSLLSHDWVPDYDAPVTERLYGAGAVLLGKTNTPELGWKGDSGNRVFGPTHNPWQEGRTAGGSSGGAAAAVAAGFGVMAQGSDGAGSIRIPSCFCGVYGIKPSWSLVPQYPSSAVELFSHVGPITRSVADAAEMLTVMAGADVRDRASLPCDVDFAAELRSCDPDLSGLKVAWSPDLGFASVEPAVADRAYAAARRFEEMGCTVAIDHPDVPDPWETVVDVIWSAAFAGLFVDTLDEIGDRLDPGLRAVVERGARFSAPDLAAANLRRVAYYHTWREFMEQYDLVLTPALTTTAFAAGADQPGEVAGATTSFLSWPAFTYPFNITGQPAATVPCGFVDGLPVGLQIVGRWREDCAVLRASAAFETIAPWSHAQPPLARPPLAADG